jgi:hypothetical protein
MQDRTEFLLTERQAKDPLLEACPSFGPGDPGYIEDGSIQAWLGTRPVVYDIRKFLEAHGVKAPGTFHLLEHHDIWLVYFAFGTSPKPLCSEMWCALGLRSNTTPTPS